MTLRIRRFICAAMSGCRLELFAKRDGCSEAIEDYECVDLATQPLELKGSN